MLTRCVGWPQLRRGKLRSGASGTREGVISLDLGVLMSWPDLCVVRGLAIGVDSLALHGCFSDLKRP